MLRLVIAALGLLTGLSAWGQAIPPGTYVFISGPGVGTPPFTVSGFSTSLGGSISNAHLPFCSGVHVHGTFNSFADPMGGGCGHGIIALFVAPPPVSGGGSLPGGHPTNVAGQLALTATFPALTGRLYGDPVAGLAFAPSLTGEMGTSRVVMFTGLNDGSFGLPQATTLQGPATAGDIPAGSTAPAFGANVLQTTLADPSQRALTSPAAMSWLEEFAAYDDRAAEGYRRDAEKTGEQADEWRKLAEDARRDAERNRQRANDARKDGREGDARDWEKEAERDEQHARDRDREGQRLDGWSEEASRREDAAREQARERRAEAERERERARQIERDRAARLRQEAEEKARQKQAERDERLRREQVERDKRIQEMEDRVRARQVEAARQRAAAEREYRQWLAEQEAQRNMRARGSSSDADLAAAAARKKKEEEERTWADKLLGFFDSGEGEKAVDKAKDTGKDYVKDKLLEAAGITDKLDELGLSDAAGKLGEGIDTLKAVKKLGDSMNAELERQPGLRRNITDRIDQLSDPKSPTQRSSTLSSGSLYGKEMFGTAARMVKENQ
jgi:hypothetical protein